MKTAMKNIAAAIALSALIAGPASAVISQTELTRDIAWVIGSDSNVRATINGNVATLIGHVPDLGDKSAAVRVAKQTPGIDRVIVLISTRS